MGKFGSIYAVEMRKIFKSKLLLIFAVIILIMLVIMAGAFEIINQSEVDFGEALTEFETAEQGLEYYKQVQIEYNSKLESGEVKNTFWKNDKGTIADYVTYYQYLVDNKLSPKSVEPYLPQNTLSQLGSGMGFVRTSMSAALSMALLMVVILSAGNFVGDINNGNMKMMLIRPVSRNAVFTAKWTASISAGMTLYLGTIFITMIYAMIRFGTSVNPVVMVSGGSAFLVSSGGVFTLEFLESTVVMFVMCQLTYFFGTISGSKNITLAVSVIFLFLGSLLTQLLSFIYIGYIDILYNINFMNLFSVGGTKYVGTNIYSALAISAAYFAGMTTVNYLSFKKKEIN